MLAGIKFSEIRIEGDCICDGHHRYLASLLAKQPIGTIQFIRTSATEITNWNSVLLEDNDWDDPEDQHIKPKRRG